MHEVAIAEEIKAAVLEQLKENKAKKVTKLKLVFGELTSVVPEALEFAFESISYKTPLEGVKIEMKIIKMKGKCKECGKEFRVKDFNYLCPGCSSTRVKLIAGKEMFIQTIEME